MQENYEKFFESLSEEYVQGELKELMTKLTDFLIDKNTKYGNSVIAPKRIFSTADNEEQIKIRLDDKLSRIKNHKDDDNEDPIWDLTGYLIWWLVIKQIKAKHNEIN